MEDFFVFIVNKDTVLNSDQICTQMISKDQKQLIYVVEKPQN